MALFAVVDKAGLKAGLNPGHDPFVNIAFALLSASGFNIKVNELLAIDDCNPQLFGMGRIKQHAFHLLLLPR